MRLPFTLFCQSERDGTIRVPGLTEKLLLAQRSKRAVETSLIDLLPFFFGGFQHAKRTSFRTGKTECDGGQKKNQYLLLNRSDFSHTFCFIASFSM